MPGEMHDASLGYNQLLRGSFAGDQHPASYRIAASCYLVLAMDVSYISKRKKNNHATATYLFFQVGKQAKQI
jgi:hypothetical protein